MNLKIYKNGCACLLLFVLITGCEKNKTKFYDDPQASGLGIFSNAGNNTFSCYINGKPWRTQARRSGLGIIGGPLNVLLELNIYKRPIDSVNDFLIFDWYGSYLGEQNGLGKISLYFTVPPNFSYTDLVALQGQRLNIDGVKNYFLLQVDNNSSDTGRGTIYFNKLNLDIMSGLLDADFDSVKLTSGRFDHNLGDGVIRF